MDGIPSQVKAQLFQGFSGLATERGPDLEVRAGEVLAEFESLFVQQWLSAARSAEEVLFADNPLRSSETQLQRDWLDQRLARRLAGGGGLGLAAVLEGQLGLGGGAPGPEPRSLADERARARPVRSGTDVAGAVGSHRGAPEPGGTRAQRAAPPRSALFPSREAFVAALGPHAERAGRALGVPSRGILAQAALETGWGERVPTRADGSSSFNLFGIKAGSAWGGARARIPTLEHGPEGLRREWADFRAYDDLEAAFADYVAFLRDHPRYAERLPGAADPEAFARALQSAGYATDPGYAEKVARIAASVPLREVRGIADGAVGP